MSDLVLGLDGGGSKTSLALADRQGNVIQLPGAAGVNAMDNPEWKNNLQTAIAGSRTYGDRIVWAVLGIPAFGETKKADQDYSSFVRTILTCEHKIINDVYMAHDGAFAGGGGILILAGTGAMLVGGKSGLERQRVGGWGEGFGDEGGAYWIGIEALRAASYAVDRLIEAPEFLALLTELISHKGQSGTEALMGWYFNQKHRRSAVAALAQHVDVWADSGNETALEILENAAGHLHRQYVALQKKLNLTKAEKSSFDWSFAGSVFRSKILKKHLVDLIGRPPIAPHLPPVGGGLWLAAKRAGWEPDDDWINMVAEQLGHARN